MPKIATPRTSASTNACLPSAAEMETYSAAQTMPESVPSTDFCSPITPPPAPTKQPRPTSTGHNCRFTFRRCEMAAHTAATIARLKALVVEALMLGLLLEGGMRRQHNERALRRATLDG